METLQGFEYTIKGFENIDKFARGILFLTNMKSSRKGTIIDFKTFEGINSVEVISLIELDSYLSDYVGEITNREEITILNIEDDYTEFSSKISKKMKELWDKDIEYKVYFDCEV